MEVVGGIASVSQLIDLALKTSNELYTLFHGLKNARKDVKHQLAVIDDLKDALGLISDYITRNRAASDPSQLRAYKSLSKCLRGLCTDIKNIRDLLPTSQPMDVWVKMSWLRRKKDILEAMNYLERRKTNIVVVLFRVMMQEQRLATQSVFDVHTSVNNLQQRMGDSTNALILQGNALEARLNSQNSAIKDSCLSTQAQGTQILGQIGEVQSVVLSTNASVEYTMNHCLTSLSFQSMIRAALQSEIEKAFVPLNDAVDNMGHTSTFLSDTIARLPTDLAEVITSQQIEANAEGTAAPANEFQSPNLQWAAVEKRPSSADRQDGGSLPERNMDTSRIAIAYQPQYTALSRKRVAARSSWYQVNIPYVGNVIFIIKTWKQWNSYSNTSESEFSISVELWSPLPVLRHRRVSLFYSTEKLRYEYFQILPLIAVHPVLLSDDPLWKLVLHEDRINDLRQALQDRRLLPNHQNQFGHSLFLIAAVSYKVEAVKTLLAMGAHRQVCLSDWLGLFLIGVEEWQRQRSIPTSVYDIFYILLDMDFDENELWPFLAVILLNDSWSRKRVWKLEPMSQTALSRLTDWTSTFRRNGVLSQQYEQDLSILRRYLESPRVKVPVDLYLLVANGLDSNAAFVNGMTVLNTALYSACWFEEHSQSVVPGDESGTLKKQNMSVKIGDELSSWPRAKVAKWMHRQLCDILHFGPDIFRIVESKCRPSHLILPANLKYPEAYFRTINWLTNVGHTCVCCNGSYWVYTATQIARLNRIEHVWEAALRDAGHDPLEIYAEDERRIKEYIRSKKGKTSAVDLDASNTASQLRRRRPQAEEVDDVVKRVEELCFFRGREAM